jgi:hypothetical protein
MVGVCGMEVLTVTLSFTDDVSGNHAFVELGIYYFFVAGVATLTCTVLSYCGMSFCLLYSHVSQPFNDWVNNAVSDT